MASLTNHTPEYSIWIDGLCDCRSSRPTVPPQDGMTAEDARQIKVLLDATGGTQVAGRYGRILSTYAAYQTLRGECDELRDDVAHEHEGFSLAIDQVNALTAELATLRARIAEGEAALERIVGMCDVPSRCSVCNRPNGIGAISACAQTALDASRGSASGREG